MKIRSSLLVACIVVVPLVAMFSHRIPPDARAAVRGWLRRVAGAQEIASARPVAARAPLPAASASPNAVQPVMAAMSDDPGDRSAPAMVGASGAAAGRVSLERLRSLGAVAIDCRPLHGAGGHVASCRMPVDGAGQLERWFQATGADAAAAAERLLHDVNAWKRDARGGMQRTMRF